MGKKRFTCRDYKINYSIQCEEISDNGDWITYGQIVDLLNTLNDENEQLKSDNKEYIKGLDLAKATSQSWASDVRELREQVRQLEKENGNLKAQLYCTFDSVCAICNNEYLEQKSVLHGNEEYEYYISKCKKGHKGCSKTDVVCCEDFELKDGDLK